jgi:signal transduction histidine kinase
MRYHSEALGIEPQAHNGTVRLDADEVLRMAANALHEGPAQQLATTSWLLALCRRDRRHTVDEATLEEALAFTQAALKSVRETIHLLTALRAPHTNLTTLLRGMVAEMRNTVPTKLYLRICDAKQVAELPFPAAWRLGAIAREGLMNALKHAGARRIAVVVGVRANKVTLHIMDDGQGFHPGPAGDRAGLGLMRRHAESLGGTLEIVKGPGRGTSVRAVVPARPGLRPPSEASRARRSG